MMIRRADAVIVPSQYGRREIKDLFGTVAAVIPEGVTVVGNPPERNAARAELNLDPNVTAMIFIGRLAALLRANTRNWRTSDNASRIVYEQMLAGEVK